MGQVPQALGRAFRAGAAQGRAVRVPLHRCAAHGTGLREVIGDRPGGAVLRRHLHDLGNDLSRLLHHHGVADADILLGDIVLVVEGGEGDGGPGQAHRLQLGLGRQHPGAAHLDHDVQNAGGLALRGIFIGDGPAGELGGAAQSLPVCQVVELHHRAVHVEGTLHPGVVEAVDFRHDIGMSTQQAIGDDLEVLGAEIVQGLRVGGEAAALGQLEVEHGDVQLPLGGDLGVQLPQRACRRVAGIGHQGLALDLPAGVELLKHTAGHIHLAPDDEMGQLLRQGHRDGADGAQIFRHVLAYLAVAPGGPPDEHAVLVFQGHGQAVHLGLHAVFRLGHGLRHPQQEIPDLLAVKDVLKALQWHVVADLFKLGQGRAAHPLGGGVRSHLLRVLPLQVLQAAEHMVVLIVADGGGVQHIIAVAVGVEGVPQLLHLGFIVHVSLILCS